ncbi:MAG: XdhC family protein [Spongiibacteraceae bacterium]|nr:XdhC family protein [Spongiibacteraceae bacterium]
MSDKNLKVICTSMSASATSSRHTGLVSLLQQYAEAGADETWFAAAVVSKEGSSYRRPGATMLVTPGGRTLGLVSGGCLEADIVLQACKAQADGVARHVIYDSSDEENIAAELGLGCNGRIGVLVQELGATERAILLQLKDELDGGRSAFLLRCYKAASDRDLGSWALLAEDGSYLAGIALPASPPLPGRGERCVDWREPEHNRRWAVCRYQPAPRLCIVGGGVDAGPVVTLARLQGWRVTVIDHRAAYARSAAFTEVEVVRLPPDTDAYALAADAVILMSHNVEMDAAWLQRVHAMPRQPTYVGLLGPASRKREVLERADIAPDSPFALRVRGPMGLDLGGDTPEAVALSVVAECHQTLARAGLVGA